LGLDIDRLGITLAVGTEHCVTHGPDLMISALILILVFKEG